MSNISPTNIEYILDEKDSGVTRTDLNGVITYACPDFEKMSGFNQKELVGNSHSIVHHPEMPSDVFADLWACLKAQQPWVGFIKNLRKDGSHFWAIVNIVPDYENEKLIGYMAVRNKATPEQIRFADDIYKKIKNGDRNFKIERGEIVKNNGSIWIPRSFC